MDNIVINQIDAGKLRELSDYFQSKKMSPFEALSLCLALAEVLKTTLKIEKATLIKLPGNPTN